MSNRLALTVQTRIDELERIASAVESFGRENDWSPAMVFRVNLVLEELGLNIMTHAYNEGLHEIEITLVSEVDAITIEIEDDGRPFDPLKDAPPPDLTRSLEDRPVGGLGIHLVRSMMDELHYQRKQGRNCLTMVSRRTE